MDAAVVKFPTTVMNVPREGWSLVWHLQQKHLTGSTLPGFEPSVSVNLMSVLKGKQRWFGGDLIVKVEPHKKVYFEAEHEFPSWEKAFEFLLQWAEKDLGMKLDPGADPPAS